jgi:hypothetical protein
MAVYGEVDPHQTQNLLLSLSWTTSLQNCEK